MSAESADCGNFMKFHGEIWTWVIFREGYVGNDSTTYPLVI